jgi:SAM-dependent methyltransferase
MCPRCGSLGRHRVDWLFLTQHTDALAGPVKLLHIAPEVCLEQPLRELPGVEYLSADYDSTLAMDEVDVTSIHYGDDRFDGVICNHVLQLVDDDRAAMRELCRVLRPGGWALLQSSVDMEREHTVDQPGTKPRDDPDRYEEIFMRTYGRDYQERLQEAGFLVTVSSFATTVAPVLARELGLDPDETIHFCRKPGADASQARPGETVPKQPVAGNDQAE